MAPKNTVNKYFLKNIFENNLMMKGKKSLSEKIFLNNIIQIQKSCFKKHTFLILNSVLNNMPLLYVRILKNKKKKKKNYQAHSLRFS